MKKIFIFMAIVLVVAITSCNKDDNDGFKYPVEEVLIEPFMLTLLVGDAGMLTVSTFPDGSDNKSINWTSSSREVATVDNNGNVTAIAPGSTTITATAKNGVTGTCIIVVISDLQKQMSVTFQHESSISIDFFILGAGAMTIDWDDGTAIETHTLSESFEIPKRYDHTYQGASTHTIKITAVNITQFTSANYFSDSNRFTNIDVSAMTSLIFFSSKFDQLTTLSLGDNTALRFLESEYNQLTSLDVSKIPAIDMLNFRNNQLNAEALNSLFGTLHSNKTEYEKHIYISGNPGADNCDKSIAERKGWTVN